MFCWSFYSSAIPTSNYLPQASKTYHSWRPKSLSLYLPFDLSSISVSKVLSRTTHMCCCSSEFHSLFIFFFYIEKIIYIEKSVFIKKNNYLVDEDWRANGWVHRHFVMNLIINFSQCFFTSAVVIMGSIENGGMSPSPKILPNKRNKQGKKIHLQVMIVKRIVWFTLARDVTRSLLSLARSRSIWLRNTFWKWRPVPQTW